MRFLWGNPVDQPVDVQFYTPSDVFSVVYDLALKIANENIRTRNPRQR